MQLMMDAKRVVFLKGEQLENRHNMLQLLKPFELFSHKRSEVI
jgi:hypothetical protein